MFVDAPLILNAQGRYSQRKRTTFGVATPLKNENSKQTLATQETPPFKLLGQMARGRAD